MYTELNIHGSFKCNKGIIPDDVTINIHHYDGTPFSHYYILSKGDKIMKASFGCGGYYPDVAEDKIKDFFTCSVNNSLYCNEEELMKDWGNIEDIEQYEIGDEPTEGDYIEGEILNNSLGD